MTPEPRSVEEALAKLDEAAEGWPTPNSYTHALALVRSEIDRLREYYVAAEAVEAGVIDFDLHAEAVNRLRNARAALARPDRQEEGS